MQIFDSNALIHCIQHAVREELEKALKEIKFQDPAQPQQEKLLTKKEMADELGVSLVTLTDWMKKGLPYLRLHKRIYFRREEVLNSMSKKSRSAR